jgi:hypothetical protein
MAFDFPASPTNGTVSNGYTWDATAGMWVGGPGVSGPVTEQFFDMSGKTAQDVTVPSWAKAVELQFHHVPVGSQFLGMRVSVDGTTFLSGAAHYVSSIPWHVFNPVSWGGQPSTGASYAQLGLQASQLATPTLTDVFFSLERKTANDGFVWRSYANGVDGASAAVTGWPYGWVDGTAPGAALRVAALRFLLSGGGAFGPNSYVKVRWIGDSAAIPATNAISDAPSTGGEYVRANGIWRLKSQTLVLDGVQTVTVPIPATAKMMRMEAIVSTATQTASCMLYWRGSIDGTNFLQGATDYYYAGMIHYAGSGGYANMPGANANLGYLTLGQDYSANQPHKVRALFPLTRAANNINIIAMVNAQYYNSPAANYYTDAQFNSMLGATNLGTSLTPLKALLFGVGNGPVGAPGAANIVCDWMY